MIEPTQNPIKQTEPETEELVMDNKLRPKAFSEYVGQEQVKTNLHIALTAAKQREEALEHVLLYGPPGLGKTTLANIIAQETSKNIKITSGASIQRAGDLAALLTNLEAGDVLFIDEIHRLHKTAEEILYPAVEDNILDILVGKGPGARSIRMPLPDFTLVGATTRIGLISGPLRDRFGHVYHLEYYTDSELSNIINRSANLLQINIEPDASLYIAGRSRGTPRIANRLLKRVRDFVQIKGHDNIDLSETKESLTALGIDPLGLDHGDRQILSTLIHKFNGGPVGLQTLSVATGEPEDTITDIYEPFLIKQGLLLRTPRGRQATTKAIEHLGKF